MTTPLHYALEDGIAILSMDDGKANALSDEMITALDEALARAAKEAKVVALLGRPERFCAGFDLKAMMASASSAMALLRRGASLLMTLYGLPIPLVVGCTGHAVAGGALMLLTGDVRVGASGAFRIGLNEVAIGLPVPVLALALVRDRIALTEQTRATLLAQIYGPEGALMAGYLDEVVPPGEVRPRVLAEARRLTGLAQPAFRASKERLRQATIDHVRATLESDMAKLLPQG